MVVEAAGWSGVATMGSGRGGGGFQQGWAWVGQKYGGLLINKQRQRHDVWAQRRDVPVGGVTDVAMLGSNVVTFQGAINPTSRR